MTKKRNALLLFVTVICIFALCFTALTSCANNDDKDDDTTQNEENKGEGDKNATYKVTFKVRENGSSGEYQTYKVVDSKNGVVELPPTPEVDGCSFRAWYTDEKCSEENVFDETNVTKDITVYAFMSDKKVTISVKDEAGKITEFKDQTVSALETVFDSEMKKANEKNLVMTGWYSNPECTTPYSNDSGSTIVYGRYMAKVTFNNGYEDLVVDAKGNEVIYVVPGETVKKPDVETVRKEYMDKDDIYFVDNDNNLSDFNFKNPISVNTVVRVLWKTRGLEFRLIEGTNNYELMGFERGEDGFIQDKDLVVSIPNRVTIDNQEVRVISAQCGDVLTAAPGVKKVIINDGIEFVEGLNSNDRTTSLEEVYLPKTLKVLERSFNDFDSLKGITIPDGTEVILECFFKDYQMMVHSEKGGAYDFEIEIPASVNNISRIAMNVKFAEGSQFVKENNMIVKNVTDGKILVSVGDNFADANGSIILPEGFVGIQVGALDGVPFKYLNLPKSFARVCYNNDKADYPAYTGDRLLVADAILEVDSDPSQKGMSDIGFAVVNQLNKHTNIIFNSSAYPEGMNKYAFANDKKDYTTTTKVLFVAEIEKDQPVKITIHYANKMAGDPYKEVIISDVLSGQTITLEELIKKGAIPVDQIVVVDKVTQFGKEVAFDAPITKNLYLDIALKFSVEGYKYKDNGDGTVTITGFNKETASLLENGISYLVAIPAEIDGKKVVAIADGAFENCNELGKIFISNTVKTIGKNAFRACKNLEFVSIATGSLEKIGEGAFEGAGAVESKYLGTAYGSLKLEKIWKINPDFEGNGINLVIKLPLSTLKEIGPRAFNTPAIKEFLPADGEESRPVFLANFYFTNDINKYNANEFYFSTSQDFSGKNKIAIVKIGDKTANTVKILDKDMTVYDYELYATAGGASTGYLPLGSNNSAMSNMSKYAFRVTIKSGAVAVYNPELKGITFGLVKAVEKDAFVYVDESFLKVDEKNNWCKFRYASYVDVTTLNNQKTADGNDFENGWFMGRDNAENTFMKNLEAGGFTPGSN